MRNRPVVHGFVVFEGLDGAGTTTQTDLLCSHLRREGVDVFRTSEPTTGPVGLLVRDILGGRVKALPATVAYLFAADRCEHLYSDGTGIVAAADRGAVVVCDRYFVSSLAYQTVDADWGVVESLNAGFPLPELTVYLDLPVETAMDRLSDRPNREIYEHLEFQRRVSGNYRRALAGIEDMGGALLWIDGDRPKELVHEEIWRCPAIRSILSR